jgi:glycosyltransferase involved in cell wall biosynthesis
LSSGTKISIVMPTFDSGQHIVRALESIADQTFKDSWPIELIAVDSGSRDNTLDALRSFSAHQHGEMVTIVLNSPIASPSFQRNLGIESASGDYIAFCDSDDYMKPDMLSSMHDAAILSNADITVCDFDMAYPDKTTERFSQLADGNFQPTENVICEYYYKFGAAPKPNNYVWSRLYKRKFLLNTGIRFPNTRYSEDHLFNLSLLFKGPKITHVGKSLYCYVQHSGSLTRKNVGKANHGQLFLDAFLSAAQMLNGHDEEIVEPILAIYAYTRIKSILFYAWQAKLPKAETSAAIETFTSNEQARKSLAMCLHNNYIGRYCQMHGISDENENILRSMLNACVENGAMPDMSKVFA